MNYQTVIPDLNINWLPGLVSQSTKIEKTGELLFG